MFIQLLNKNREPELITDYQIVRVVGQLNNTTTIGTPLYEYSVSLGYHDVLKLLTSGREFVDLCVDSAGKIGDAEERKGREGFSSAVKQMNSFDKDCVSYGEFKKFCSELSVEGFGIVVYDGEVRQVSVVHYDDDMAILHVSSNSKDNPLTLLRSDVRSIEGNGSDKIIITLTNGETRTFHKGLPVTLESWREMLKTLQSNIGKRIQVGKELVNVLLHLYDDDQMIIKTYNGDTLSKIYRVGLLAINPPHGDKLSIVSYNGNVLTFFTGDGEDWIKHGR